MVKDKNVRIVVTLPKWLISEFENTHYYKEIADNKMSNAARIFMLKIVAEEKQNKISTIDRLDKL